MEFYTFADEVSSRFEFLIQDYRCSKPNDRTNVYMRSLTYRNQVCEVKVSYEMSSRPWVVLSRLKQRGDHVIPADGVNLMVIIEDAGKQMAVVDWGAQDVSDEVLIADIQFQADALRAHGDPFLRGDFARWPYFVQKQREVHQRRREMFGENPEGGVSS